MVMRVHTPTLPSVLVLAAAPAPAPDAVGVPFAPDAFALTALFAARLPFPFVAGVALEFPFSLVLDASESSGCVGRGAFFMVKEIDGYSSRSLTIRVLSCQSTKLRSGIGYALHW